MLRQPLSAAASPATRSNSGDDGSLPRQSPPDHESKNSEHTHDASEKYDKAARPEDVQGFPGG